MCERIQTKKPLQMWHLKGLLNERKTLLLIVFHLFFQFLQVAAFKFLDKNTPQQIGPPQIHASPVVCHQKDVLLIDHQTKTVIQHRLEIGVDIARLFQPQVATGKQGFLIFVRRPRTDDRNDPHQAIDVRMHASNCVVDQALAWSPGLSPEIEYFNNKMALIISQKKKIGSTFLIFYK